MQHLLKRLELNGFKSFAQRISLEFPAGITAVVGPNGSGKSNVVDAIRWLLGEREAKNLRGAKVEDLIFAGTPKRARLSQAQASLHFLNPLLERRAQANGQKRFFPVDFEEVTVMREVRRDGVSRYFINKSEILLRDLIDFFAKARLGSRGLIIVGQGNSDMFIEASPTGRREMIEEILGLREYQLKKLDAERRLKSSELNLEKAKALIEEILPHLRSLKRQTARWQKRETLVEELRNLENTVFGSQWRELKEKIESFDREIRENEAELDSLKRVKDAAAAKEHEVEATQPKEREMLRNVKERVQKILGERSEIQKSLGRIEARLELEVKEKSGVSTVSSAEAVNLLRKIKDELASRVSGDLEMLRESVHKILSEIDSVFSVGVPGRKESPDLREEFEKISVELARLEQDLIALREEEKKLEQGQESFYAAFKAAVAELERAKDDIEKWEMSHQQKKFEKERLQLRREELERQIRQAGREPEEFARIEIQGAGDEFSALERRMFKLRGDLASIGEIDEALMREAQETETRYEFLSRESADLEKAKKDLRGLVAELDTKIKSEFEGSLVKINEEFSKFFELMFGGGQAKLEIVKPPKLEKPVRAEGGESEVMPAAAEMPEVVAEEKDEAGGIEIKLKLPRKKLNSLEMLSGGERSLVGIATLFALISVSPPPFLVLDEIDAALDDRNARRFAELLKEFAKKTQFLVVTHNRATMEAANVLYGVTLNEDGTSKILSLKLE